MGLHGSSRHQAPLDEAANLFHLYEPVFALPSVFGGRTRQLSRLAEALRLENLLHISYPAIHDRSATLSMVYTDCTVHLNEFSERLRQL
jgi:hypothetical protein